MSFRTVSFHPVTFRAAALAVAAWMAGCSGPPAPAAKLPPLQRATPFDGVYAASVRNDGQGPIGDLTWCDTTRRLPLRIVDSQFSISLPHPNVPGNPTTVFDVYVTPDGQFRAQSNNGGALLMGQVANGRLQANMNGAGCQYAITAMRS